jgi:uncharacterized protein (DUF1501 family)
MKRRTFIKSSSLISLPILVGGMKVAAIPHSPFTSSMNGSDKVLVLIQLNGGNDGLNTLIPIDQYDKLQAVRQNVIVPENSILELEDTLGFHPVMNGMQSLYLDGKMNIIQDVGYPNQNRSHFRSTDIWTSGSASNVFENTGWLGRYFDNSYSGFPEGYPNEDCPDPFALTVGSFVSQTCQGISSNFSTAVVDPENISNINVGEEGEVDPNSCYGMQLTFLRQSVAQTNAYGEAISTAVDNGTNMADYPGDNRLAEQLKIVARLIAGGLQTSVYVVSLGGFDTHANQVTANSTMEGNHANLLRMLSEAVTIFQQDIELLGINERVVGMTFSEFGRRIKSNNSLGTDHGTAAPLFVFGSCVNPTITGENFELPNEIGNQDGTPMQYDFRSVYGSILVDWFEVSESVVQDLLYEDFQYLPIIQSCSVSTETEPKEHYQIEMEVSPNPLSDWATITYYSQGEQTRISLFDMRGQELRLISDQFFPFGEHQVPVEFRGLPPGNYCIRVQTSAHQRSKIVQKVK